MKRRRMRYQDREIEVLDLDFEAVSEAWNDYRLLDGGTVRIKTIALRISWILDEHGQRTYTPEGDPNIMVNHTTNVVCTEGS